MKNILFVFCLSFFFFSYSQTTKKTVSALRITKSPTIDGVLNEPFWEKAQEAKDFVMFEHGDGGTLEVFKLMKEKGVAFCPTLAAGDAISQYSGWEKGKGQEPERITYKKKSFKDALASGVTIIMGGDVGVYSHGDNVR